MSGDSELLARQTANQRGFYRALAHGSVGSRLIELDGGVQATVAPVRPWYSIFNSVLYTEPGALINALPQLTSEYEAAGSKAWTVWVPPTDAATPAALQAAGHVLDSTPMLMGASISEIDLDQRLELDLDPAPTWRMVAVCNDAAHGVLEDWSMAAVVENVHDPATQCYAATLHGRVACALLAREHDRDCYFWFVASIPEARGLGLAGELVRVALRTAQQRGCETTTLESTAMAESLYANLGFRALGRYEMWERRSA